MLEMQKNSILYNIKHDNVRELQTKNIDNLIDQTNFHINPFELGCKMRTTSLLAAAAYYGAADCVRYLYSYLKKKAPPNIAEIQAEACMYAIMGGNSTVIEIFKNLIIFSL